MMIVPDLGLLEGEVMDEVAEMAAMMAAGVIELKNGETMTTRINNIIHQQYV